MSYFLVSNLRLIWSIKGGLNQDSSRQKWLSGNFDSNIKEKQIIVGKDMNLVIVLLNNIIWVFWTVFRTGFIRTVDSAFVLKIVHFVHDNAFSHLFILVRKVIVTFGLLLFNRFGFVTIFFFRNFLWNEFVT